MKIDKEILCKPITEEETETFINTHSEIQNWLRRKGKKTSLNYARNLMRYLQILTKNEIARTPQDLYALAKEENEFGTRHCDILEEFQESASEVQGLEAKIYNVSITVKSFYSFKGKNYQFPKSRGDYNYKIKKSKRVPSLQDVDPYVQGLPHLRNKVIIAMETCFPVRLESLTFLKWKHFKEVLEDPKKELPHVFLVSEEMKGKGKGNYEGIEQHSFLTSYAKKYVLLWREEYQRLTGKQISVENPQSLEEPFLIALKGEGKGEKLSYGALNNCFERLKSERYPYTLHIWRTFTNRALEDAVIEEKYRNVIIGHKPRNSVEESYTDKSISRLREQFSKALRFLDPELKEDEHVKTAMDWFKEKNIQVSEEEAKDFVRKALSKFLGSA